MTAGDSRRGAGDKFTSVPGRNRHGAQAWPAFFETTKSNGARFARHGRGHFGDRALVDCRTPRAAFQHSDLHGHRIGRNPGWYIENNGPLRPLAREAELAPARERRWCSLSTFG